MQVLYCIQNEEGGDAMKARVFVLDVIQNDTRIVEVDGDELDDYFYKELDCNIFDVAVRKVGDVRYDIFCDDMGLLKEDPVVSAIDQNGKPMLVGNLLLANHDDQGRTASLSLEAVENIYRHIAVLRSPEKYSGQKVLICEH